MAIKETKNIYEALQQYHEEIIKPKINEIVNSTAETDNKISVDLAKETSDREIADYNLSIRVDEETLSRVTRDVEITNQLNTEIARVTKKAEAELEAGLVQEAHKRIEEDLAIRDLLTIESNLRTEDYGKLFR
jgi:hypothetical protein